MTWQVWFASSRNRRAGSAEDAVAPIDLRRQEPLLAPALWDSRGQLRCANGRSAMHNERRLLRQLAGHLMMGASLGALLALWLLETNFQRLFDVIAGSEAPIIMHAVFVTGLAAHFAFGAALTAFLMIGSEDA
uniref:Uncharacterized protein n=1 Tax=Rhodopseudomonas palustris (strain BisA53) TaxID=316055 RepID=Q07LB6_RHOP5